MSRGHHNEYDIVVCEYSHNVKPLKYMFLRNYTSYYYTSSVYVKIFLYMYIFKKSYIFPPSLKSVMQTHTSLNSIR